MRLALSVGIALLAASAVGSAQAGTDFYVGLQGGYLTSRSDVKIPAGTREFWLTSSGGEGGIFAGFTTPISPKWSFGLEADFNLAGANGTHLSGGPPGELYKIDQNWNGSARALLGFWLTPTTEIYGTAGWRTASVDASYVPLAGGVKTVDENGYVAGLGLEDRIAPNWFVRGEWRYSHTGRGTVVHVGPSSFDLTSNEALFGVGFVF